MRASSFCIEPSTWEGRGFPQTASQPASKNLECCSWWSVATLASAAYPVHETMTARWCSDALAACSAACSAARIARTASDPVRAFSSTEKFSSMKMTSKRPPPAASIAASAVAAWLHTSCELMHRASARASSFRFDDMSSAMRTRSSLARESVTLSGVPSRAVPSRCWAGSGGGGGKDAPSRTATENLNSVPAWRSVQGERNSSVEPIDTSSFCARYRPMPQPTSTPLAGWTAVRRVCLALSVRPTPESRTITVTMPIGPSCPSAALAASASSPPLPAPRS